MIALLLIPAALATTCPTITGTYDGQARVPVEGGRATVDLTLDIQEQEACSFSGQAIFSGDAVQEHLGADVVFSLTGTVDETGALQTAMSGSFPGGRSFNSTGEGSARPLDDDGAGEGEPPPAADGDDESVDLEALQSEVLRWVTRELELQKVRGEGDNDVYNLWW